ncbi:MAG: nitroreductase [Acidobacteriota bacterium]|jgi:nitroreductase
MDISEAISQRKSIRAFKPDPVSKDVLKEILQESLRAPSWANTQPWEFAVATGTPLDAIRTGFLERSRTSPSPDVPRPPEFPERYAARIRVLDKQNRLITKNDWESRRVQNFNHYGAPAVIYLLTSRDFYCQAKGLNVWALYDCGSVVQNILLLARKHNLGTIVQAQAVAYPEVLRAVLGIPESKIFFLGIAVGYPDWSDSINEFWTEREPLEKISTWHGF